jgi:hypothetical protein
MFIESGSPMSKDAPTDLSNLTRLTTGTQRITMNGNGNGNGNGGALTNGCNCPQPQSLMGNQNLVIWIAIGLALIYLVKK